MIGAGTRCSERACRNGASAIGGLRPHKHERPADAGRFVSQDAQRLPPGM
jgi:hypothetical protein